MYKYDGVIPRSGVRENPIYAVVETYWPTKPDTVVTELNTIVEQRLAKLKAMGRLAQPRQDDDVLWMVGNALDKGRIILTLRPKIPQLDIELIRTFGILLVRIGRYEDAIPFIDRARTENPDDELISGAIKKIEAHVPKAWEEHKGAKERPAGSFNRGAQGKIPVGGKGGKNPHRRGTRLYSKPPHHHEPPPEEETTHDVFDLRL